MAWRLRLPTANPPPAPTAYDRLVGQIIEEARVERVNHLSEYVRQREEEALAHARAEERVEHYRRSLSSPPAIDPPDLFLRAAEASRRYAEAETDQQGAWPRQEIPRLDASRPVPGAAGPASPMSVDDLVADNQQALMALIGAIGPNRGATFLRLLMRTAGKGAVQNLAGAEALALAQREPGPVQHIRNLGARVREEAASYAGSAEALRRLGYNPLAAWNPHTHRGLREFPVLRGE